MNESGTNDLESIVQRIDVDRLHDTVEQIGQQVECEGVDDATLGWLYIMREMYHLNPSQSDILDYPYFNKIRRTHTEPPDFFS